MFLICSWFLLESQPGPCLPLGFCSECPVTFRMKIRDLCSALRDARDGRDKEGQSRVHGRVSSVAASGDWKCRDVGPAQRQGHWSSPGRPLDRVWRAKCKWPLTQRRGTPGRRPTSAKDRASDALADWKAEAGAGRVRLQSSDSCGKRRPCRWVGEHGRRAWVET